jgi:poly-beta-hydroxyalkanoate depolymerase
MDVNFYHKLSPDYEPKYVLRNASETAKTIKIIKEILTETPWSKHLQFDDLDKLRRKIVEQLITTEKSFLEIKKLYFLSCHFDEGEIT